MQVLSKRHVPEEQLSFPRQLQRRFILFKWRQGAKVGTLTSSSLYTSISNALSSICPEPTVGFGTCTTNNVVIEGIEYVEDDGNLLPGTLEVSVDTSSYGSAAILNSMIILAANTAMGGATGSNCNETKYQIDGDKVSAQESKILCNAPNFAGVQFYDGILTDAAAGWMDAHGEVKTEQGTDFNCEGVLDPIKEIFDALAPEFSGETDTVFEEIEIICDAAVSLVSHVTSVYAQGTQIYGVFSSMSVIPSRVTAIVGTLTSAIGSATAALNQATATGT
jgi:hypothetical protein